MSFYTSLSGLKGAQTDLATVSNNVANVGTVGFKKSRTEFGDLISSSPLQASSSIVGQGTRLKAISQQFTQGASETTGNALDLLVSGQGFFVTRGELNGGAVAFTRNGAFTVDSERYVTDSSGAYLQVLPVDRSGIVTATGLNAATNLQLPLTSGQPRATDALELALTLPASAEIPPNAPVAGASFDRTDATSFNNQTSVTVYDALGNAVQATLYFTRTELTDTTATPPTSGQWDARLFVGSQEVSTVAGASPPTPLALTFDAAGVLTSPTGATAYPAITLPGASAPLELDLSFAGTTRQLPSTFAVTATQNGFAAGKLSNVTVGKDGLVTAAFSNGEKRALGKVVLANFSNPAGLAQQGDSKWQVTGDSGDPLIGEANSDGFGGVQSGALERANVDITEELVALISAQRNFQANAKAIETANAMTQTIVNLRS